MQKKTIYDVKKTQLVTNIYQHVHERGIYSHSKCVMYNMLIKF